jgi:hypothetical protein
MLDMRVNTEMMVDFMPVGSPASASAPGGDRQASSPVYTIALSLQVGSAEMLWDQAAAKAMTALEMSLDDVIDMIGPREDAQVEDCLMLLLQPSVAGCTLRSFTCNPEKMPARRIAPRHGPAMEPGHAAIRVADPRHRTPASGKAIACPIALGPDFG